MHAKDKGLNVFRRLLVVYTTTEALQINMSDTDCQHLLDEL